MNTSGRKFLVTGATGYVGQHLVYSLTKKGYEVYVFTRKETPLFIDTKNVTVIRGDIALPLVLPSDIDTIFHCAGAIHNLPALENVNVLGTKNIVTFAIKNKCKLIHLSSAGVTGNTKEKVIGRVHRLQSTKRIRNIKIYS